MNELTERILRVKERVQELSLNGKSVTLLAVTKKQPIENIQLAHQLGIRHFGNNYVQDGKHLMQLLSGYADVHWHFIGHIQSRKVRELSSYSMIESVSRTEVAEKLNENFCGKKQELLIQVNIGEESSKSGVFPQELESFVEKLEGMHSLRVRGLMALPPPYFPIELRVPNFVKMRDLFLKFGKSRGWDVLSMGTSDDYELAIEHGATLVRLGTALFGNRK